jgi:hypothetical protein
MQVIFMPVMEPLYLTLTDLWIIVIISGDLAADR